MSSHPSSNKDLDFEKIYTMYYPKLVRFSKEYVLTRADAENIVQDIFVHLWEKRKTLDKIQSINAFLFRLVKNKNRKKERIFILQTLLVLISQL